MPSLSASSSSASRRLAGLRGNSALPEMRLRYWVMVRLSNTGWPSSVTTQGILPSGLTEEGAIFDSRAITQYLNRLSGGALFPRNAAKRTDAERLEALADGICDCLLAHVYERRMRPAEKVHQPWLDLQWSKAVRALDRLNDAPPRFGKKPTAGHIALRAALGYLDLRFAGQWERGRSKLKRWASRFDERFPELKQYLPV